MTEQILYQKLSIYLLDSIGKQIYLLPKNPLFIYFQHCPTARLRLPFLAVIPVPKYYHHLEGAHKTRCAISVVVYHAENGSILYE